MYSFEGEFRRRPQQSLGGASRNEKRDELLLRASIERQKREASRRKIQSAVTLQAFLRGSITRLKLRRLERNRFDGLRQKITTELNEASYNQMIRSLVFFYDEEQDVQRLLWLCQNMLRQSAMIGKLVMFEGAEWKFRMMKILYHTLNYLARISNDNIPIAIPMRMLEVYTNVQTYSSNCDEQHVVLVLAQMHSFLVKKGFFKLMYIIINAKIPDSLEKSPIPPTPLSGSLFSLLFLPIKFVLNGLDNVQGCQILREFVTEFFCQPFTEQISCFVVPALLESDFPLVQLLLSLLSTDQEEFMRSIDTLLLPPTPWLLYFVLHLASRHHGSLKGNLVNIYLHVLHDLTATIHKVESRSTSLDYSTDSEDEEKIPEVPSGSVINDDMRNVINECIELINDARHVQLLLSAIELGRQNLKSVCCIAHDLLTHQRLSVYQYRLLYTLAFKQVFLKQLWQAIISASSVSTFGTSTPLLQILVRGLSLGLQDQDEIVPMLSLFCSLFSYMLLTLHDAEVHGDKTANAPGNPMPFSISEIGTMSLVLRDICLGLIELAFPDTRPTIRDDYRHAVGGVSGTSLNSGSSSSATVNEQARIWSHLFKVTVNLVQQLYNRDSRRPFCPKGHWISSKVHIPLTRTLELCFRKGRSRKYRPFSTQRLYSKDALDEGPPLTVTEIRNLTILRELPFVVPFTDRVVVLQQFILKDKHENQTEMTNFLSGPIIQVMIRRNYIYEDAFEKLSSDNEPNMKLKMRVQLVNAIGLDEAGIDGGGIFREFLSELLKTAFDPNRGFFRMSQDNLLYPNPNVQLLFDNAGLHYYFIGRMLGKALYENMLVELPLAGFFLTKLLSRNAGNVDIHHLNSLDPVMYRNLLYLKHYEGDVSELGLDFAVVNNELGETQVEELKPNGINIPVTSANCIEYIHLVADYKLNRQIRHQCNAFRKGLAELVNLEWLQMFDAHELQVLISGASVPVDLHDLKQHTVYSGGYSTDHAVIKTFWKVVENMDERRRRQLLKFVTSCSRPPLLGFKELYPALCIQNAGPGDRLPTASTCMNLLKLPEMHDENVMRAKLLYAIESCSGFELS